MAIHSFDPEIAAKVGVNAAVLYQNLLFWCEKNQANKRHIHDGKVWTYNSRQAFTELFPYLTEKQVRLALDKLRDEGLVETGNFNSSPYDRTMWYHVAALGNAVGPNGPMKECDASDTLAQKGRPIPDSKPDIKPDKIERARATRLPADWVPDPITASFAAKHGITRSIVADEFEKFVNHWVSQPGQKGRKVDWNATWRNWLIRSREYSGGRGGGSYSSKPSAMRNTLNILQEIASDE